MTQTQQIVEDTRFKKRFMTRLFAVLAGGTFLDGYILGIIGPVTAVLQHELNFSALQVGLLAAMTMIGMLIGAPLGGWATDKWGRKPLFIIDIALFVVASVLQFFVGSAELLMFIRFVMGLAIGCEYSVSWPMLSEFAPSRSRGRLMSINQFAFFGGFMVAYALAFYLSAIGVSWHLILGSSTVLAVALLLGRIGLPESARWLWSKGRQDEARAIAHKYMDGPATIADFGRASQEAERVRFVEIFSKENIRSTAFISIFWFCNVLPYFGISTFAGAVLSQYGLADGLAGGVGLSMVAVLGVALTMLLIDKAGRRILTAPPQWIMLGIFLMLGLWSSAPSWLVLVLFLLFSLLSAVNGVLTSVYPSELFPTAVRGIGTGFAAAFSRLGAALGTFLLPAGIEALGISTVLLMLAGVVAVGAIVSQIWAPETKGKSLSAVSH
ncbi:MFS transporter [Paenarthrobacter sp. NPDC090520]|uniref:MFS transporter n=1 Tax=Paenarthrobacter sp. NPDC090520 TaxID=3364382 RepID=UPI00380FF82B